MHSSMGTLIDALQGGARQDDGRWVLTTFEGLTARFRLGSVPTEVPMDEVYRRIEFPEPPLRQVEG